MRTLSVGTILILLAGITVNRGCAQNVADTVKPLIQLVPAPQQSEPVQLSFPWRSIRLAQTSGLVPSTSSTQSTATPLAITHGFVQPPVARFSYYNNAGVGFYVPSKMFDEFPLQAVEMPVSSGDYVWNSLG